MKTKIALVSIFLAAACGGAATHSGSTSSTGSTHSSTGSSGGSSGGDPGSAPDGGDLAPGSDPSSSPSPSAAPALDGFDSDTTSLSIGARVRFTVVVSGAVVGGQLTDPTGNVEYGAFSATQTGHYELSLSWDQINAALPIDFTHDGDTRSFVAQFFDPAGGSTTRSLALALHCNGSGACNGVCTDVSSDHDNCGACGVNAGGRECVGGKPVCPDDTTYCAATDECAYLQIDSSNCGACGVKVAGPRTCINGQPACEDPNATFCSASNTCVFPEYDQNNCGACGNVCPSNANTCAFGVCYSQTQFSATAESCDTVCKAAGLACAGPVGVAAYTGKSLDNTACNAVPASTLDSESFMSIQCYCK